MFLFDSCFRMQKALSPLRTNFLLLHYHIIGRIWNQILFWTVVLEKTLESPLDCKEIKPVHPKGDQSWTFIGRTDAKAETPALATWYEELTHWKRPWCWERFKAGREGDNRGLNGWKASPTQWTWVWASSGCWWWTWRPGMLQSMGLQRVRHDWETELNWLYFITVVWEMHRTTTFFKKTGAHLWHPWFIKYIEVPLPLPSLPCFRVS